MVRLREIVEHSPEYDLLDTLQDQELSNSIYKLYDTVIFISDRFSILPHELPLNGSKYKNMLEYLLVTCGDKYKSKSTAKMMLDELQWFFEIE